VARPRSTPPAAARPLKFRTSDTKRFYSNRNNLLVLLKNARLLLLLLVPLQLGLLVLEGAAALALVRRWGLCAALIGTPWRIAGGLRRHILAERRRIGYSVAGATCGCCASSAGA